MFRALGRNHDVLRIVAAYAAFSVCEYGLWIAVLVYAYDAGGATTAGIVAVAQLVPAAVVAVLVAPLTERSSPVVVLLGGYAVQALGATATAALVLAGAPSLLVYAGAVVVSGAFATTRPAQSALVPAMATEVNQLTACNVLIGWVENLSILVSGLAVGLALSFGNTGHAFAGAAVLLGGAFLLVAPLRRLSLGRRGTTQVEGGSESRRDLAELWDDPPARLLVTLLGVEHIIVGSLDLLFVVMAVDVLDAGDAWAGYLNTAYGTGALVLGALTALTVGRRLGPVIVCASVVLGLALAASMTALLVPVVLLLALVGGARTMYDVAVRVLLQRSVPPDRLARVFGFAEGLSMVGLAIGAALVPALVALGGAGLAIIGTAALLPVVVLARVRVLAGIDKHAHVPVVEISLLRQVAIFRVLPGAEIEALAQSMERVTFDPGTALIREGERGDHYYAIADGNVEISQHGRPIRSLARADGLGEIALLRAVPRTATAVAVTPVTAYRLDRDAFLTAVVGHAPTLDSAREVVRGHEERDAGRKQPRETS